MTYHLSHCAALFGANVRPNTDLTNWYADVSLHTRFVSHTRAPRYYGAANIAATNVIYTQGSQDPWQRAGVQQTLDPLQPEVTIECHNCGHCVDLRGCPSGCSDLAALEAARATIIDVMGSWVSM
jgi:hypothetical protein